MSEMNDDWPALPYEEWKDTYATLHMWSQVVGKVALAQAPALNHCWGSALRLTSRGFETAVLSHGSRRFSIVPSCLRCCGRFCQVSTSGRCRGNRCIRARLRGR